MEAKGANIFCAIVNLFHENINPIIIPRINTIIDVIKPVQSIFTFCWLSMLMEDRPNWIYKNKFNGINANDNNDEAVVIAIDNGKSAPIVNAKKFENIPPGHVEVNINAIDVS